MTSTGYHLGSGTVFSVTPSGTESVLYSFKAASGDGRRPEAGLINVKGTFYGTTSVGGATGGGTVFSLTP
ncbi:MAG: choice-of-anchor tandem repeat GloVer-containing protein [Candidatus Cybelea sp.]